MKILSELNIAIQNSGANLTASSWSKDNDSGEIHSVNPSNEELIASVYNTSAKEYEYIVQEAQKHFLSWRKVPAPKRGEIIRQIGNALRAKKDYLGTLVSLEMGKSLQEGLGEVQEMIDMADFAVGQSRMLYGNTMHSERSEHRMYEQWHPLGVVGIMSAFNFPVAVWAWNAFLAVICGNTVIWKPSPKTPLCALAVQHICNDVMHENQLTGIFSVFVTDNLDLTKTFVEDKRVALLSFTGSTHVGRLINESLAKRFGKVILELSGNNAIIVDKTAHLALAIPAIVFGAIGTAGQRCTSTRRLFVHESLYDKCVKALTDAYQKITIGDPLDAHHLMGPLIDADALSHFKSAITSAQGAGGKVLAGGNALNQRGYFVEPTLIAAKNEWPIVQEETFAPILYIMSFSDIDQAIQLQNESQYGLSSALFTNDLQHAEQFLSCIGSDCGIANINIGTSGAEIGGAFGGEKNTGGGREAGSDAWKNYMRRQTNTINWGKSTPLAQGITFDF